MIKLKKIEAPRSEEGLIPIILSDETMQSRKAHLLKNMQKNGFDAVVVYVGLGHGSNSEYLYGFLSRFEEALLILRADSGTFIVLGDENLNKAGKVRIEAVPIHMPHFSLPDQPTRTEKSVAQILASCGLRDAEKVGLIGWKNLISHVRNSRLLFDLPYFLVEALKTVYGKTQFANAACLLIGENDVQTANNVNKSAHHECGTVLVGNCILRTVGHLKVGKTETEVAEALAANGQHRSVITIMAAGARFEEINLYPGDKQIQCNNKVSITTGFKGGPQSHTSYTVECARQLPEKEQDYLKTAAVPYFQAVKTWLGTIKIGVDGNDLYETVGAVLPKEGYGQILNPGHLYAGEEWMFSPIYPQSEETLRSSMLFQIDIIPSVDDHGGASYKNGVLLADERLRKATTREYLTVWERVVEHRAYMQEML